MYKYIQILIALDVSPIVVFSTHLCMDTFHHNSRLAGVQDSLFISTASLWKGFAMKKTGRELLVWWCFPCLAGYFFFRGFEILKAGDSETNIYESMRGTTAGDRAYKEPYHNPTSHNYLASWSSGTAWYPKQQFF